MPNVIRLPAGRFLAIALVLAMPAAADQEFQKQPDQVSYSAPPPINTAVKKQSGTANATESSISASIDIEERWPLSSASEDGQGTAEGSRIQRWVWDGSSELISASYNVLFLGNGAIGVNGTANVGFGFGLSASAAADASSRGDGSADGATVDASLNSVGGTAYHDVDADLQGEANVSPQGAGMSAGISETSTAIGSFARTALWSINKQFQCGATGDTIIVPTSHRCVYAITASANGALASPARAKGVVEVDAEMDAIVSNITYKVDDK